MSTLDLELLTLRVLETVSAHLGRTAVCPVLRSAGRGCAARTRPRRHAHALACPVLGAVFECDATPASAQRLLTWSGGSGGKAEERQSACKGGNGKEREAEFRVASLCGLRERQDGGYC